MNEPEPNNANKWITDTFKLKSQLCQVAMNCYIEQRNERPKLQRLILAEYNWMRRTLKPTEKIILTEAGLTEMIEDIETFIKKWNIILQPKKCL